MDLISAIQIKTQRRQRVARYIYESWTKGGADISGLAEPVLIDRRLDTLSNYVIEYYHDLDYGRNQDYMSKGEDDTCNKNRVMKRIENVNAKDLPYDDFCTKYMYQNIPVIIQGISETWSCSKDWVTKDANAPQLVPNLLYIQLQFGNDIVPVHEQSVAGFQCPQQRPDVNQSKQMTVREFVSWWINRNPNNSHHQHNHDSLLYLKDWKFAMAHSKSSIYELSHYFHDDWLNEGTNGAYKFIYLGPKGTCTALHADVLRSFSWSTNICGQKLWCLIPPQYTHLLYDCFGTKLAYHIHADMSNSTNDKVCNFMSILYPGLRYVRKYAISVIQQAKETIFVPSNWFHTVENMSDTLSINHNWFNAANICQCWQYVESKVRRSCTNTSLQQGHHDYDKVNIEYMYAQNDQSPSNKLDDDVYLLWNIVVNKGKKIIQQNETTLVSQQKLDLERILLVIDGILSLNHDGCITITQLNGNDDIHRLRKAIVNSLLYFFWFMEFISFTRYRKISSNDRNLGLPCGGYQ
jgi:JmjC domain, hydroxylase